MSGSIPCKEFSDRCEDCLSRLFAGLRACSYVHGGLPNRAIRDFGEFLVVMHSYLMYGNTVENDIHFTPFQKMILRDLYDPKDICDYIRLFEFYCQWLLFWSDLSIKLMNILGAEKFAELIGIKISKEEKEKKAEKTSSK